MSRYTIYYGRRKQTYRVLAKQWKDWSKTATLTEEEVSGIDKFFRPIARRFGLTKDFKDIGVISDCTENK